MKILFFTKYNIKGASSRYRTYQYLPILEEQNFICDVSYLFGNYYLKALYSKNILKFLFAFLSYIKRFINLFKSYKYDIIIIEYELFPYFPSIFEHLLKFFGKRYIVDYDDAVFHNYDLNKNLPVRYLLKNKIKKVMKNAYAVIVGSEYLFEYASKSNKNVYKIPTVVNTNIYKNVNSKEKKDTFVIGWIGSPTTSHYLLELIDVFKRLQDMPLKFKFIGTDEKIRDRFEGLPVEWLDWNPENEIEEIKSFSVGIMPLDETPWSRGKCGFKLIQYMASGLPVVASPIGENNIIVKNDINGFLAKDSNDWFHYLCRLNNERSLSQKMGIEGLDIAEKKYSLEMASKRYIDIIKDLM